MKYNSLTELKEHRPQLVKKLIGWGIQRKNKHGFRSKEQIDSATIDIEKEVEEYLDELVFTPTTCQQVKDKLIRWGMKLTTNERQAIGLILPYELKEPHGLVIVNSPEKDRWYDGTYKVLDEEVINTITYGNKDIGLITENSYGAAILNSNDMLIIDIDLHSDNPEFNIAFHPEQVVCSLKVLAEKENLNFRLYKTAGGFRAIETSTSWNPTNYIVQKLMKSVYADPLYIALCRSQECFRARLTPKPWRIWGTIDYDNFTTGNEWIKEQGEYESEVKVCSLFKIIGEDKIDDKFKEVIIYHDNITKALNNNSDLILV